MSRNSGADLTTLLGPWARISGFWEADVAIPTFCRSDVRRSGGLIIVSFVVAVVIGLLPVEGRTVVDNDERFTPGLALVVSMEAESGRIR